MKKVIEYLIENSNFSISKNQKTIRKKLFADYEVIIKQDKKVDSEIYIYINSERFSRIMFSMFSDMKGNYNYDSLAHEYSPRVLRKDTSGNLAMGMVALLENDSLGEFSNGGVNIAIQEFSEIVNNIDSAAKLYQKLYFSPLNNLVATLEGIWVYIYMSYEAGISVSDILLSLKNKEVTNNQLSSVLDKDIDEDILNEFWRIKKEN